MKTLPTSGIITEPGLYDLPAAVYHRDPTETGSLSYSTTKLLLEPGGPAEFKARQTAPRQQLPAFDIGTALHALILGKGRDQLVEIKADSWRTKAAKEQREAAYANGLTPLLTKELDELRALAASVDSELRAAFLGGHPEVAMFWQHDGQWLRGQADYYIPGECIIDLKTMRDVSQRGYERAVWDLRYYMQAAWYQRGIEAITGERLPYYIVAIEKTPTPGGLVRGQMRQMSEDYLELGRMHMDKALKIYKHCQAADEWPAYPAFGEQLTPPPWALSELERAAADDEITKLTKLLGA